MRSPFSISGGFQTSKDHQRVEGAAAASICLLCLSRLAAPVRAAPPPAPSAEQVTNPVSVADLDMNTRTALEAADLRLRAAARTACGRFFDESRSGSWEADIDFYSDSVASARLQLNTARLSAREDRKE